MATLKQMREAATIAVKAIPADVVMELVDSQHTKRYEGDKYLFRGKLDKQATVHCKVYVPINAVERWWGTELTLSLPEDVTKFGEAKSDPTVGIVNFRDESIGLIVDLFAPESANIDSLTVNFPDKG